MSTVSPLTPIGECSNKDCPFLHINATTSATGCPWYDRGFCRHGELLGWVLGWAGAAHVPYSPVTGGPLLPLAQSPATSEVAEPQWVVWGPPGNGTGCLVGIWTQGSKGPRELKGNGAAGGSWAPEIPAGQGVLLCPCKQEPLLCVAGPLCKYKHTRRLMCTNYLVGFCPEGPKCKFMQ